MINNYLTELCFVKNSITWFITALQQTSTNKWNFKCTWKRITCGFWRLNLFHQIHIRNSFERLQRYPLIGPQSKQEDIRQNQIIFEIKHIWRMEFSQYLFRILLHSRATVYLRVTPFEVKKLFPTYFRSSYFEDRPIQNLIRYFTKINLLYNNYFVPTY